MTESVPLIHLEQLNLKLSDKKAKTDLTILRDVSFVACKGEVVAIVGESGSGKSMTTRAIMGLLPDGAKVAGSIRFEGRELIGQSKRDLVAFRSSRASMIYQDPRAHINPVWTVGDFLIEAVVSAGVLSKAQAKVKAMELLREVGIEDGERRLEFYPHQLSGGLLQRMMIVGALMSDPDLIIADEATTALDVTVQAEVMKVFRKLQASHDLTLLFITHDLDLAASVADTIVVMYAGRVIERGPARALYEHPSHPYTAALLRARPNPHSRERLQSIPGRPASAADAIAGCAFAERCRFAVEVCRTEVPQIRHVFDTDVACHRAEVIADELVEA